MVTRRILSLDGGGVRGAVTVAYLMRLEELLSERAGQPVCLGDCFDLIGGTSTGAIIATAIAFGFPVAEIKDFYFHLAPRVFKTSPLRVPTLRHVFDGELLRAEIHGIIGDATLGSSDVRTGLAIVTKRVDTGSPWIVSNNRQGKFWDDPEDGSYIGNRHLRLVDLLRASTAAPHYFAPEKIAITDGASPGLFVDGGVTPHNNPCMALFQLVSVPGYGYNWRLGRDNLTILSIGTGSYRKTLDTAAAGRMPAALLALQGLTGLIQDGEQNVLTMMQLLGYSPDPVPINSEIGHVSDTPVLTDPLFAFQRYDVHLESAWLAELMGRAFSPGEIEDLRAFDRPEIVPYVYDIASRAAQEQIKPEHVDLFFADMTEMNPR